MPEGTGASTCQRAGEDRSGEDEDVEKESCEMECGGEAQTPHDIPELVGHEHPTYSPATEAMKLGGLKKWFPSVGVR